MKKLNPEQRAFQSLHVLTSGFVDDVFARIGDEKTVSIGSNVSMHLKVLDMGRVDTQYYITVMDDQKLEAFSWKVKAYSSGFARALTFEQCGVIQLRADREEDASRDVEAFFKINEFFQEFLDSCFGEMSQVAGSQAA